MPLPQHQRLRWQSSPDQIAADPAGPAQGLTIACGCTFVGTSPASMSSCRLQHSTEAAVFPSASAKVATPWSDTSGVSQPEIDILVSLAICSVSRHSRLERWQTHRLHAGWQGVSVTKQVSRPSTCARITQHTAQTQNLRSSLEREKDTAANEKNDINLCIDKALIEVAQPQTSLTPEVPQTSAKGRGGSP